MLGSTPGVKLVLDEADEGVDGVAKTLPEEAEGAPTLISVGSRGLGAVQRARVGSVPTKVIRAARGAARGPVLVYPHARAGSEEANGKDPNGKDPNGG